MRAIHKACRKNILYFPVGQYGFTTDMAVSTVKNRYDKRKHTTALHTMGLNIPVKNINLCMDGDYVTLDVLGEFCERIIAFNITTKRD